MKKNILTFSAIMMLALLVASPVLAVEEERAEGPVLFVQLITLVVVGGIIYNLFISMTGFGGVIGSALKMIGLGVLVLAIGTIDEVVEGLTGIGSETIFGEGLVHDVFHDGVVLLGFFILGFGLSKLTKFVKSVK